MNICCVETLCKNWKHLLVEELNFDKYVDHRSFLRGWLPLKYGCNLLEGFQQYCNLSLRRGQVSDCMDNFDSFLIQWYSWVLYMDEIIQYRKPDVCSECWIFRKENLKKCNLKVFFGFYYFGLLKYFIVWNMSTEIIVTGKNIYYYMNRWELMLCSWWWDDGNSIIPAWKRKRIIL